MAALIAVSITVGHFESRKTALKYGHTLKVAISVVSVSGFSNTENVRSFFISPEMSAMRGRLEMLSIFGADYCALSDELQEGMIYLSKQMALAPAQRFYAPPSLKYFSLLLNDRTDNGVADAAMNLVSSYESQIK